MENEENVSVRESLEQAVNEENKAEQVASEVTPMETPPMESSINIEEPSDQQTEGAAPSDVTEPVADDPSIEGSVTPSGDTDVKDITEVVKEQPVEKSNPDQSVQGTAPASWKGDAKKLWGDLPADVRSEISRREKDTLQVLQKSAEDRKILQSVNDAITPHNDLITASYGGDPLKAIGGLLNTEKILTSGNQATKAQVVARIIQNFGVDVNALDAVLSGKDMPPEVRQQSEVQQAVSQAVAPLHQYIQQQKLREQQAVQARSNRVTQQIEGMANDPVNYPYFNEVREDMADIVEMSANRGIDISLEEAYTKAVNFNGRTASANGQRVSAQTDTQKALEAHQEAQAAKGASVSVSGSPSSTGPSAPTDTGDLRSVITHAMGNQKDRV
jgi:hypothetical protein